METKKVIEQENDIPVIVDHTNSEGNRIFVGSSVGGAYIEKSKATEVAKAICPKYQELEDELKRVLNSERIWSEKCNFHYEESIKYQNQNAKLLEALKKITPQKILDIITENYKVFKGTNEAEIHSSNDIFDLIYSAIQQSETKEK